MHNTKQMQKLTSQLDHYPSRTRQVFKTTHLSRILRKHIQESDTDRWRKEFTTEEWLKSFLLMQIQKISRIRLFVRQLAKNPQWQGICGFTGNVPTQGQYSHRIPDPRFHEVMIQTFQTYQKLISLKRQHLPFNFSPAQLDVLTHRYQPFWVDCTSFLISPKRYIYARKGYVATEKKALPSMRIHAVMEGFHGVLVNYGPTAGNEHESPVANQLLAETDELDAWLQHGLLGKQLRPLIVFDRAYWKKKRFHELDQRGWGWVIPWKKRTLIRAQLEIIAFPSFHNEPLELLVWPQKSFHPWRRIIGNCSDSSEQVWDLLTGDLTLKPSTIIALGKERWAIEQLFAWMKQQTSLKQPLGQSWMSFVTHCLLVALLQVVLVLFLLLLGIPRWQRFITKLLEDLRYSDQTSWSEDLLLTAVMSWR
jgi:hypothetical protein